jgi:hypothetical protein
MPENTFSSSTTITKTKATNNSVFDNRSFKERKSLGKLNLIL